MVKFESCSKLNFLVTKQLSWDTFPEWEIAERKNGERVSPFFLSSETTLAFLGSHQHPFALAVCLLCASERRYQQPSGRSSTVRACRYTACTWRGASLSRLSSCALLHACCGRCFVQISLRKAGLISEPERLGRWKMKGTDENNFLGCLLSTLRS